MAYAEIIGGVVLVILVPKLWKAFVLLLWRPHVMTKCFQKQGLKGRPYKFLRGSLQEIESMHKDARQMIMDVGSHDITPKVLPHYHRWTSQYGKTFFYWFGAKARLCIRDPEMVRQVLSNKFGFFTKIKLGPSFMALMGKGLVFAEGSDWARHRRVVSPAFTMDKLKMMDKSIAECTLSMLHGWQEKLSKDELECKEIEMAEQLKELTANVISHTAFGSSYTEGKEVFLAQLELQHIALASIFNVPIPGMQYLPTKRNLRRWELERRMKSTLTHIIESRLDSKGSSYGDDLLGLMLEACMAESSVRQVNLRLTRDEIIDECKTFFFAGHETTSHLLTWAMFLLSTNHQWQERLREEVLKECRMEIPNADMLSKLKLVQMVLLEALRLYCPVNLLSREAAKDISLGNLEIPKGTIVTMPLVMIHRDKEYWGEDANEFIPLRFENGVSQAAKHPNALIAFSIGPRACVGQNFAMLEAKIVMAMILQRFSFTLSPQYKHAPASMLTLQPQFGLPIVLKQLYI